MKENLLGSIKKPQDTIKTGNEKFHNGNEQLAQNLRSFWQWSYSDHSNTWRGILAEYIVALAINYDTSTPRDEWAPVDFIKDDLKIEVKSSCPIQRWKQKKPSPITFGIAPTMAWDNEQGGWIGKPKRHADLYVFCILNRQCKEEVDPRDLQQWEFYILATEILDEKFQDQKDIRLSVIENTVKENGWRQYSFSELGEHIKKIGEKYRLSRKIKQNTAVHNAP